MIQSLVILTQLMGWTLLEARQAAGDPVSYATAQDLALAGSPLFVPGVFMKNPLGVALRPGWHLQASGQWNVYHETRSVPVYDPFNNTLGYATQYSFYAPDLAVQSLSLSFATRHAGMGIGWDEPVNASYAYEKVDRLDVYTPIRREKVDQRGTLRRLTVAFGARYHGWFLGAAYQHHREEIQIREDLWTPETGDSVTTDTLSFQGTGFAMSLGYQWGYRMKVGWTYRSGAYDNGMGIPGQWDLAAELTPRTRWPSKIFLRVGREQWSQVSLSYRDIWRFHFGLQHGLYPRTAFMIGGMIRQSYAEHLWIATYTGGLSYTLIPGLAFQVGIAWTPVSHSQLDNGTRTWIQETLTQVAWGIRWSR